MILFASAAMPYDDLRSKKYAALEDSLRSASGIAMFRRRHDHVALCIRKTGFPL
jgi:hypothetical protein